MLRSKIAIQVLLFGIFIILAVAQQQPARSQIIIHVQKAGLLSAFGHNHTVVAPISQAVIDAKNRSVEITVPAKQMKVTDKEVSNSDRAEIQSTMLGPKVLDTDKYAEVRFKSTRVEPAGPQHFRVTGILTLHGVSKEISFEVTESPGHYQGKSRLKQTEFGVQPVSAAGGSIKVKDEVEIEFDVYPGDFANGNRR